VVHPHVVIGDQVEIGSGSVICPQVTIYARSVIGERVRIHSGAVIGADGYGYEWDGARHRKKIHNGRVRIGDDVEVGANTTIDRATTGETVVGAGTKIDNLVQVAHNVRTGIHCLLVSQAGIAGSSTLGDGAVLGGQAGLPDHTRMGDRAIIGAGGGPWGNVEAGEVVIGRPARPRAEERRIQAALGRLPELFKRVRELEARLENVQRGDHEAPGGDDEDGAGKSAAT
jgi:UDP-3-O-[3-hydroxymyristoyl] glucosamine N-acyltransferase